MLAALPAEVAAVRPAIVGHDPRLPLSGRRFEDEVDRLARALPPAAGGDCHLAGYSMGARLALGLLARHRRRFASATLIGVHPGLASAGERRARQASDEALARRLESEGLERFIDHWQSLPLFRTQAGLPPAVLAAQRRQRLRHDPAGLAYALRLLGLGQMPDYRAELARLELPIRLLAGELDGKFRRLGESMAEALPQAEVEVVPGAGHNLLLEAPRAVAAAILSPASPLPDASCDGRA